MSATTLASRSQLLLRRCPQFLARRHESTAAKAKDATANTASAAKDTATNATSKASEGLSRVSSSAGSGVSRVAQGASAILGRIGGRTGRLIKTVESLIPPTVYYSRVGLELSRLVFQGQKMSPPPVATFQSYLTPALHVLRNPSSLLRASESTTGATPEGVLSRLRNMSRAQMVFGGVVFAEMLGFFTVGEMVGRMKLVGYRGDTGHHEEH